MLAGLGASSNGTVGSLANPGDRFFVLIWQLLVSAYIGMLLGAAPNSSKPLERGRMARRATRAVLILLALSFVQAAIGYSRGNKGTTLASTVTSDNSAPYPSSLANGDATVWANNYRNAKFITRAEILRQVGPVHLTVRQRARVSECVHDLEGMVRRSAAAHGWAFSPDPTDVEMVVDADIERSKITTTEYTDFGPVEQSGYHMTYIVAVQVGFMTKANCLRGDKFVQMNLYLSRSWNTYFGYMGDLVNFETFYAKAFHEAIDGLFQSVGNIKDADDPDDETAWKASLWPAARDDEMYKSYLSPIPSDPGSPGRIFYGITKFHLDKVDLFDEATNDFDASAIRQDWQNELASNGYDIDPSSDIRIHHQFGASKVSGGWLSGAVYYFDQSAIRVWQRNVVFPFKGELRRGKVCIWSDVDCAIALPKEYGNTARDLLRRSMRSATNQFASRR